MIWSSKPTNPKDYLNNHGGFGPLLTWENILEPLKLIADALGCKLERVGSRYHIKYPNGSHAVAHTLEDVAFYLVRDINRLRNPERSTPSYRLDTM